MTIVLFVLVAAGATLARAVMTANQAGDAIPWRTLAVNVVGAAILGFVLARQWGHLSVLVTVAGLGSLTTFSTVAAEIAALLDDGRRRTAILYLGLTLVAGIIAARLGLELGALT